MGPHGKGAIPGGKAAVMENAGHHSLSLMVLPQTEPGIGRVDYFLSFVQSFEAS